MPSCFLWLEIEILAISLNEKTGGSVFLQYACDPGSFLDCLSCSPPARSLPAVRYTSIRRIGPLPRLR